MFNRAQYAKTSLKSEPAASSGPVRSKPLAPVLQLQQQLGNQVVQRLLQSRYIQAKLTIGAPDDIYEQQADRVASQVMRMPDPMLQREVNDLDEDKLEDEKIQAKPLGHTITSNIQRLCPECEKEPQRRSLEAEEESEMLQTKAIPGGTSMVNTQTENAITGLRGRGDPLSSVERAFMEPRFGHDFSHVRVHTDASANNLARSINARAFTLGNDVVFGSGQYSIGSIKGRYLLAHELTHVIQQKGSSQKTLRRQLDHCKIDPCIQIEGREICGQAAADVCGKARWIPGCNLVCKIFSCKKPDETGDTCPTGWRLSTSGEFKGQCCEGLHANKQKCCEPGRVVTSLSGKSRCCPPGTVPNKLEGKCKEVSGIPPQWKYCPEGHLTLDGSKCCWPPQRPKGFECVEPTIPPPVTKPPGGKTTVVHEVLRIGFNKDAPQTWFNPAASYRVSVTSNGKSSFERLLRSLKSENTLQVELTGNASSDKPAGDINYNDRLSERRARLILGELEKRGVDKSRINSPSNTVTPSGCHSLDQGLLACGDSGAAKSVSTQDRNVTARTFEEE